MRRRTRGFAPALSAVSPQGEPREYSARILSSKPSKRRWPLRTSFGSNVPLRSLGVLTGTGPCSVTSVFGVVPLRALPVPPGGSSWGS